MTKYIYIVLGVVVVVLFGALHYQSSVIDELNITTKQQAQTIQQQEDANKALTIALQQERDAVIEQQQRDDEIERIATENAESVKTIIKTQPCAHTRLPQSALDACTNKVTTKAEYIYPPQAYTAPCVKTAFTGETYGDVVIQLVKVTAERDKCASQVDNLNKWINQTKTAN